MSFLNEMIEITDASRREMESMQSIQKMLKGQYSEEDYIKLLKDLYPIVLNFCPIMAAAASRCDFHSSDIKDYFYGHIEEEKGHQQMVLDDLLAFNVLPEKVIEQFPSFPVQAMLGFNYYLADRAHPAGVLGMVYVLEVISSVYGGQVSTAISKSMDRPLSSGFSFLDSHSSLDMEHMSKLRALLQSTVSADANKIMMESVKMNFYLFKQILNH